MNHIKFYSLSLKKVSIPMPPGMDWRESCLKYFSLLNTRHGIAWEDYTLMDNVVLLRDNYKPALVLAGGQDPYVFVEEARILYDLIPGPKEFYLFPDSGHCNAAMGPDKEAFEEALLGFLSRYF